MRKAEYERHDNLFPNINNSLSFGKSCSLCKRHHNFIGQDIIWGNGSRDASLMIVGKDSAGESPVEPLWKGSRRILIPLTNKKSGAKMRIMLSRAGINPHTVFFTNIVKCNVGYNKLRPKYPKYDDESFRKLAYKILATSCIQHLYTEINEIKPKVIIFLGKDTFKTVFPKNVQSNTRLLEINDLEKSEMPSKSIPFVWKYNNNLSIEIFNLRHPSRVEGENKEQNYIKNLEIIKDML